jgi:hypothetical protein
VSPPYPKEKVPSDALLYRRIWVDHVKRKGVDPRAFMNSPQKVVGERRGMSTCWDEYADPIDALKEFDPKLDGVAALRVKDVEAIESQVVEHEPEDENQAHTEVFGPKDPQVRTLLRRAASLVYNRGKPVLPPIPCSGPITDL